MISELAILTLGVLIVPLCMRGSTLHNYLAAEVADALRCHGFDVHLEYPVHLDDGRRNDVDVYAVRGADILIVEIETTPRHAIDNARKAVHAGLPLWIVVPNTRVQIAIQKKLRSAHLSRDALPGAIQILLSGQVQQALTNRFSIFPAANAPGSGGKRIRRQSEDEDPCN